MKVRKPAVAGYFYESDPEKLREQIKRTYLHRIGPGNLPQRPRSRASKPMLLIMPHAGYMYSGPVAAHGYYLLSKTGYYDSIIIIGPNHHLMGNPLATYPGDAWETPLGKVAINKGLDSLIRDNCEILASDELAHTYEHSIEVQLPFMQHIFGSISFVPISMGVQDFYIAQKLGECLEKSLKNRESFLIIASSDFSHYERGDIAEEKDMMAIQKILEIDSKGLYDIIIENNITMCGYGPVMVLLEIAKRLGVSSARLLKYAHSGHVTGDFSSVVGYAAIVLA